MVSILPLISPKAPINPDTLNSPSNSNTRTPITLYYTYQSKYPLLVFLFQQPYNSPNTLITLYYP